MSGYYRDPRDTREYRDRYARDPREDRNYQYHSRDYPSSSRTRSPDDRRGDGYYANRRERDIPMRERDPYEDRRSDAYYCREREFDRDAPYAPRGVQRGMERERERERERDYYDRDSRHARGYSDYQDAVPSYRRPQSPYGSRRSPPYRSGPVSPQHQPCRYPQSPPYERRESIPPRHSSHLTEEAPTRDVVIPTGPRGAPTGPRSSFGRPPTGPSSGYDNRGVGPPPPAAPRGPSFDGPPRSISRRVDEEGTPLSASAAPSFTTDKYSGWDNGETQKDVEPTVEPRVGTTSALDVPITAISLSRQASSDLPPRESVKKRLGNLHQMDFTGSGCAEQEAQVSRVVCSI